VIEIGDTTLRDVGCNMDVHHLLDLNREAILYVHYHYWRKPVILGVKYLDNDKKYLMRTGTVIASVIAYLIFYPLFALIAGVFVGAMGGVMSVVGTLIALAGLGLAIANAFILAKVYVQAKAG